MKKFYILSTSQGCISNFNEEALYTDYLIKVGFEKTSDENNADLVVLNSCSHLPVTKSQTENFINKYRSCKNLIITGCYPLMYKGEFNKLKIHYFKPGDLQGLSKLVEVEYTDVQLNDNIIKVDNTYLLDPYQILLFKLRPIFSKHFNFVYKRSLYWKNFIETATISSEFFVVRTGIGCLGNCTFCGIKRSKGRIKSKSLGSIISEIDRAQDDKIKLICLGGEDVGCWGQDIGTTSVLLLKEVLANAGNKKIVIEYFDPEWLMKYVDELIPLFSDKRIVNVTFALQCGSTKVIDLMGRKYNPIEVCHIISKIRSKNPNIIIKSNTIAGFPQETWYDFLLTIYTFFYLDGTSVDAFGLVDGAEASVMSGQKSEFTKLLRAAILHFFNIGIILKNLLLNLLFPKPN